MTDFRRKKERKKEKKVQTVKLLPIKENSPNCTGNRTQDLLINQDVTTDGKK